MWIRIPLLTQNNHFITVEVIYVSNAFSDIYTINGTHVRMVNDLLIFC